MGLDEKSLLPIAGILGVIQGLVIFIGGLIIAFDRNERVIFKSYCSSINTFIDLYLMNGRNYFISGSRSAAVDVAGQEIVHAMFILQIEVGSRDSMIIVMINRARMRARTIALQKVIPLSLLYLLLLHVVLVG